ncbi:MAG: NAD(P)H-binding protein [Acidobacteriota bacterium]
MSTILVTGATGLTGREVCAHLVARGGETTVRAAVRTPEKAALLPSEVETVAFDTADPATMAAALDGVDAVYLVAPGGPLGPRVTAPIVEAIKNAPSVGRVVKLSSYGPEKSPQAPTDHWALETEQMVRETGLQWTFLRPPWFFQNFTTGYFAPMLGMGAIALPFGAGPSGWVDVRDLAAMTVEALLTDDHVDQIYTPTGPRTVTIGEIAAAFAGAIERPIGYVPLDDDAYVNGARAMGMSDMEAHGTLALMAKTRDGHTDEATNDVERVIGRAPISLEQFASDYRELLLELATTPPAGPPGGGPRPAEV